LVIIAKGRECLMGRSPMKLMEMYEGLKNRFLFDNDINSIYILLALYDFEENISNIYPKYTCTKDMERRVNYTLANRKDRKTISHNISLLIHEDINRLELCFYLEGYKRGYYDNRWVNILEQKALNVLGINYIYENDYLFHHGSTIKDVGEIQLQIRKEIDNEERKSRYIEGLVYTFANKIIKKKLKNLNSYIDKQLKMEFNPYAYYISEDNIRLNDAPR